ncbi:MAG: hypothetical protein GDA46_04910 [Bdellovibrionales bacterium]|nr:hypothetical protein [Bdellovibrionales bacterium]
MKYLFYFILFIFCSCVSNTKNYDSVTASSKKASSQRNVSALKNISEREDSISEGNYKFVSKQMRRLIGSYKKMKQQLSYIEDKLNTTLDKLASYKDKHFQEESNSRTHLIKDQITIQDNKGEEIVLNINKIEDYKYLMGEVLAGDYDISETETKRALAELKEKLNQTQEKISRQNQEQEKKNFNKEEEDLKKAKYKTISKGQEKEQEESQEKEDSSKDIFNEDDLIEEIKEEEDVFSFKEDDKIPSELVEGESTFLLAKRLFDEKSYEEAIFEFHKYRNENPKGKNYMEATFYIGKSFDQLKMPIEAEIFFTEIVKTDSDSLWALRAKKHLEQ